MSQLQHNHVLLNLCAINCFQETKTKREGGRERERQSERERKRERVSPDTYQ